MLTTFREQPADRINKECISCTQPEHDGRLICFTDAWKVILHPDQSALASLLIVARRHVPKVSQLSPAESAEFHAIYSIIEPALEKTFGAQLINISCERNWAYRLQNPDPPLSNGQPNPHVHWHVAPRYNRPIIFREETWSDLSFGEPLIWAKRSVAKELCNQIIKQIQQNLPLEYQSV